MSLKQEQQNDLREAIRLMEEARSSLTNFTDFDSVRTDANLLTALTSAKAALAIATGLQKAPEDG